MQASRGTAKARGLRPRGRGLRPHPEYSSPLINRLITHSPYLKWEGRSVSMCVAYEKRRSISTSVAFQNICTTQPANHTDAPARGAHRDRSRS